MDAGLIRQANSGVFMFKMKRLAAPAALLTSLALLSACADSAATPDTVTALSPAERASLKIADITDVAGPGVVMANFDLDRILQRVKAEISSAHPDIWVVPNAPQDNGVTKVKIVITRYDQGNAFARFMLAGLGQIHIEGDVIFTDAATGKQVGEYKVAKDFAFGGMYGGITNIEDVEKGFAKSVAQILETKQSSVLARMRTG
jgi:hypothetical protein